MSRERVLLDLWRERDRQEEKFPAQELPDGTGQPGDYELAVAARFSCDRAVEAGTVSWRHVLKEEVREALAERDPDALRAELVQVAAVAVRWVEAIDRRRARAAA